MKDSTQTINFVENKLAKEATEHYVRLAGKQCFHLGLSRDLCPIDLGTSWYDCWMAGYNAAKEEQEK